MTSTKELILEKLRQGKTPALVVEELARGGVRTSVENVWKEGALARRRGEAIPKFNTSQERHQEVVKTSARMGTLASDRIKQRNRVAKSYLRGLNPADIILSGQSSKVDPLEAISLCSDLSPIRGDGLKLSWLKSNKFIPQETETLAEATDHLIAGWANAERERDSARSQVNQRDKEILSLRDEKSRLEATVTNQRLELGRCNNRISSLEVEASNSREHERKVLSASSHLEKLIANRGIDQALRLIGRTEVPDQLERLVESENFRLTEARREVKEAKSYAAYVRLSADEYSSALVESATKQVSLAERLSGVPKERLDMLTTSVVMLQTDPLYVAKVWRQVPYRAKVNIFVNFDEGLQVETLGAMAEGSRISTEIEYTRRMHELEMEVQASLFRAREEVQRSLKYRW